MPPALPARVTVLDLSEVQLERDREAARHWGFDLTTIHGDMQDLSRLEPHFFDQILGQHNLAAQIPAMTGTLSVRYRRGTPILRDLVFEVRHEARGDRKVRTFGTLSADGEVVSEGEGLFVIPNRADWVP